MATPAPSDKVKDKEYTNWLKVTLALYYMKSGMHTFIENEVNCLHQSLVNKIYGGQTVPLPPCTMCDARHVKRNKYTGVWEFQKQCGSYCGVWLHELLKLHTNPTSEKIYWDNSHVPSWPLDSWECAKVFMPRGQQATNTGPTECDVQALLTLLTSCTHFHPKLSPQGLGLTHIISTIRNKVMHNGEMKLSDADRVCFIQQIVQLLEDPKHLMSLEDCKAAVGNIRKIANDSIDVFWNVDLEMTALRELVIEVSQELGLEKIRTSDNVNSLKEEYRQLREQLTQGLKDVGTRMDTIERDVQSVMEKTDTVLQQHDSVLTRMSANVTSHGDRLDTVKENVEYIYIRMDTIQGDVRSIKEQTYTALQQEEKQKEMYTTTTSQQNERISNVETKMDKTEKDVQSVMGKTDTVLQQQKQLKKSLETMSAKQGVRINKVEKNIVKLQKGFGQMAREKEIPTKRRAESDGLRQRKKICTKRRAESDGLRQLKSQTEDILNTFRRIGFIPTTQTVEAKTLLQEKRSVVIKGNPGEGKTSTALHLIDSDNYINQRVVVKSPEDWKKVDTDWVRIVVIEDIVGQYDFDPGLLQEWIHKYLQIIQNHVDVGKLQVIITIREDILLKAYSKLKSFRLFFSDMSLTLSSEKLTYLEKMSILDRNLKRNNKNMDVDEKEQCIINVGGLIGFPQCCYLFAGDKDLFGQGPEFFKSPEKFLLDNIIHLNGDSFLSLAFLFCNGEIEEEYLSPSQKKSEKYLLVLKDLASYLNISFNKSTMVSLRESYDHFSGLYVNKVFSYELDSGGNFSHEHHSGVNDRNSYIQFSHATVYDAVGQVLGYKGPEMVVKYGDSAYLYQRTYTAKVKDSTSQNVFIPKSVYGLLVKRIIDDVVNKELVEKVVKHSSFRQHCFLMKLKDELCKRNIITDFLKANTLYKYQNLSDGKCLTFLQCMLQNDKEVVRLVYSLFLELLKCKHSKKNSGDCWQCNEKHKLLELALYYHHFEIADKLITMNACYTHVSLCNAARYGDFSRVQTILEYLKKNLIFNPESINAKKALCRAYISGNQDVIETLLQEGITLDSRNVIDAVQHQDINVLKKVVEHLKYHDKWNPLKERDSEYFQAFVFSDILDLMHGPSCHFLEIDEIPCSIALYMAYFNEKFDMADYLLKNEAKVSLHMIAYVSEYSTVQAVASVIQNLQATHTWNPHCGDSSKALEKAYGKNKYDVCNLLIMEGVSLTIENFPGVVKDVLVSLESVKKALQHLKDTERWDPKCYCAHQALKKAYMKEKDDVCDLLIQEGVSLTMKDLQGVNLESQVSLTSVKKIIQHLKDKGCWNPKCDEVSKAIEKAYLKGIYDVCDLLVQEGVSLTMKHLPYIILRSLEDVKMSVKQLKDTDSWDPMCDDASNALEKAYCAQKYDVCELLVQEGVSLTMSHLPYVILRPLEYLKASVKQLKKTDNWDQECDHAFKALGKAYGKQKYDVCNLLIEEGVSLKMKNLSHVIQRSLSLDYVKTLVNLLKYADRWDPMCNNASEALDEAYSKQRYDVCDIRVQEGVSITMKHFPYVIFKSVEYVKRAVKYLKDTNLWDPNCDDAFEALAKAYSNQRYDVCDLLVLEGVSLTMKNLLGVIMRGSMVPLESVKKAIQHLKDTNCWDPKSEDASNTLERVYWAQKYDVCDLLAQEGVSLTMKNLPGVMMGLHVSLDTVEKVMGHKCIIIWFRRVSH